MRDNKKERQEASNLNKVNLDVNSKWKQRPGVKYYTEQVAVAANKLNNR